MDTTRRKKRIISKFLLPIALKNINLNVDLISIDDNALEYLIDIANDTSISKDGKSGVRQLKHLIDEILMKINFLRTISDSSDNHLELSFNIKNFAIPLIITKDVIVELNVKKCATDMPFFTMYNWWQSFRSPSANANEQKKKLRQNNGTMLYILIRVWTRLGVRVIIWLRIMLRAWFWLIVALDSVQWAISSDSITR